MSEKFDQSREHNPDVEISSKQEITRPNSLEYFNKKFESLTDEQKEYLEEWAKMEGVPSNEIRDKFFEVFDKSFRELFAYLNPEIKKEDRSLAPLVDKDGNQIAEIEKYHVPAIELPDYDSLTSRFGKRDYYWAVIDFDDVINNTTSAHIDLRDKFAELGLEPEKFKELYDAAKLPNEEGKKVLKFDRFIDTIKQAMPEKATEVERVVAEIDYPSFIDQAVKRALQSIQHTGAFVRVSILTYGDRDYQKMRVDATGMDDIVHETIYTEGSKKEVVNALMDQERVHRGKIRVEGQDELPSPMFITLDDSPDHIDDYAGISQQNNYLNIRYHHPQAKRYDKKTEDNKHIIFDESSPNQAALDIHHLFQLLTWKYKSKKDKVDKQKIFNDLRDPTKYKEMGLDGFKNSDSSISWEMIPGSDDKQPPRVRRRYDAKYPDWGAMKEARLNNSYSINADGTTNFATSNIGGNVKTDYFDFEEYIREAK